MGEVWKAEDTQLRRTVALKFLAPESVGEPEVKDRLIREAQAVASLDHPNICAVHGIHDEQGKTFIAMAYIDGPSLDEKIQERPLPLDEALTIAGEIADGLREAHENGVVHRDIKPQNILLTAKGQVKLMDFGLAALSGRSRLTKAGTTLGTPTYMSPEQIEGRDTDHRADIWALGCVLYEMLTQRAPFAADYEQAIAYGIINETPEPVTAIRSGLPIDVDRIISKALAKDPDERYQHAADLTVDLKALAKESRSGRTQIVPAPIQPQSATGVSPVWRWTALGAALLAVVSSAALLLRPSDTAANLPLRTFSFSPPEFDPRTVARISPDGRFVVYVAGSPSSLWVQDLAQETPTKIEGTEGARKSAWSPDSRSIAFTVDGELRTISANGGIAVSICKVGGSPVYHYLDWSAMSDEIFFAQGPPPRIFAVAASGGVPRLVTAEGENGPLENFSMGGLLPASVGFNAAVVSGGATWGPTSPLSVIDADNGSTIVGLGVSGFPLSYSPTGHIIYSESGFSSSTFWALPIRIAPIEGEGPNRS